jgi:hypothetical protein
VRVIHKVRVIDGKIRYLVLLRASGSIIRKRILWLGCSSFCESKFLVQLNNFGKFRLETIELVYLLVTKAPSGVVIFATGAKKNTTLKVGRVAFS